MNLRYLLMRTLYAVSCVRSSVRGSSVAVGWLRRPSDPGVCWKHMTQEDEVARGVKTNPNAVQDIQRAREWSAHSLTRTTEARQIQLLYS